MNVHFVSCYMLCDFFFFFFQAEDGIRDKLVTGVQTCALPISCILWQVPVKAPGTANSATFLPLKTSSVVFHAGPSDVITRNFASGTRSPTLMGMVVFLSLAVEPLS